MTHQGLYISRLSRSFLALLLGACLVAGCGDDSNGGDEDTDEPDITVDQDEDVGPTDTVDEEMTVPCTSADNRCIGSERRAVCQEDGSVSLESCPDDELCWAGECGPVVCEAGQVESCAENGFYVGCNPQGTGEGEFACPAGQVCQGDACVEKVCDEGESVCGENDQVLVCDETGTGFIPSTICTDVDVKRVCDEGECKPICDVAVKTASYVGCEYWAVDLDNHIDAHGQPFAVVVSNSDPELEANVTVYQKDGWAEGTPMVERTVPPNELAVLILPPDCYDGPTCQEAFAVNNTSLVPAAYRIEADLPITAYQFNPLDNVDVFSNDASLLFPKTSLGRRYRIMSRKQVTNQFNFRGWMTIVATEEEATSVTVTVTSKTLLGARPDGTTIDSIRKGGSETFRLQQFDVLTLLTDEIDGDLTGSEVVADQLVAVFGGSEASSAPETDPYTCCADHLEQQLYPVNTWGVRYHAVKSKPRNGERDLWRIMARQDGTVVNTSPQQTEFPIQLNAGEWVELITDEDFTVTSNRPILVGQFLTSEEDPIDPERGGPGPNSAGTGDPAFILGVPVEQYRTDYIFLAPSQYEFDFITVVTETGATVSLDGTEIPADEFFPFDDGTYSAAKLAVEDGVHRITSSEPSGLFVYGYDRYVSYGYPAGLNLEDLFQ